ncbi:MAG: hypothetical protein ABI181_02605 [Mycobacteriaceae bacterium]
MAEPTAAPSTPALWTLITGNAQAALAETLAGALTGASTPSPPLRPRTATDLLRELLRSGPVGDRRRT